ncbi:MAG: hypothetical protein KUG77_09065 [Nannocystaceae bacterium]|nr:hypothetical protein [Nannocystaceae bacterium]
MKRVLGIGLVALLGTSGCDGESGGDGSGSGASSSESTDTNPTGPDTLTTMTPTTAGSTSGSTSGSPSTTDAVTTTTEGTTTTDGETEGETEGASSSSTGDPGGVTPCQPEMSKAAISAWQLDVDDHMPTFAEIAVTVPDFQASSQSADGFTELPQQGGGFIMDPDGGGLNVECDIWAQDCEDGEKCAPWANDGGSAWNATRCVPIDLDPVGVGEACVVEGSGVSGIDNCEAGSMCWDVDGETNEGTCVSLCEGSPEAPTCAPAGTACSIANQGVLIVCLPICNPLADECAEGQGCYPVGEVFQCAPDASSGDQGQPGDPCEFINACDNGSGCVNPTLVPCPAGSAGCCSSFCDVTGDGSECLGGQECVPWFEMGEEPDMCLEGVGVCTLPA